METKYHISPKDNQVRVCRAQKACRFASYFGKGRVYETKQQAATASARLATKRAILNSQKQKSLRSIFKVDLYSHQYDLTINQTPMTIQEASKNYKISIQQGKNPEVAKLQEIMSVGYGQLDDLYQLLENYKSPQDHRKRMSKFLEDRGIQMATDEAVALMGIDHTQFIEAAKCFPLSWINASNLEIQPRLSIKPEKYENINKRGVYNKVTGAIEYSATLTNSEKLSSHFAHELTHRVEAILADELNDPALLSVEMRTTFAGGRKENLLFESARSFYYRRDEFFDIYSGREYLEDLNYQELFAVGYESLFFNRDAGSPFVGKKDSDTVAFVLGLTLTQGAMK